MKKLVSFSWEPDQNRVFAKLKIEFSMALELAHFNYKKEIVFATNTLIYISTSVLSQYNDQ
jgi:hypothetical protein